jgi:hypothetical protein
MNEWIGGSELHEPLVDVHAFGIAALEREVVSLNSQDIDIIGIAVEHAGEEVYFEIELRLIGGLDESAAG